MPRVESNAECTIVVLVFRSIRWLTWCMEGLDSSKNQTKYRWCVVANDATEEVATSDLITVDFRNDNPKEYYINRVYRAWSEGVLNSPTSWCILLNTDMFPGDYAIDELMEAKYADPKSLPCGLLVENGRIPSGMPEYVKDFGTNPNEFRKKEFLDHALSIQRRGQSESGRLYQPVLFDRQQYFDLGGYPEGNIGGVSGDKILFDLYKASGFNWVTCLGSVWYHAQCGEQMWP